MNQAEERGRDQFVVIEIARQFGVSAAVVRRAIKTGRLPAWKFGRTHLIRLQDALQWAAERRRTLPPRGAARQAPGGDSAAAIERRAVAIHEAGHALFTLSQGGIVEWMTCESWVEDESGKRYGMKDEDGERLLGLTFCTFPAELRDRPEVRLASTLAGVEAEWAVNRQTDHAQELVTGFAMALAWLKEEWEAHAACWWLNDGLEDLFAREAAALAALTVALLEHGVLREAGVAAAVAAAGGITVCPVPPWESVREAALASHAGERFSMAGEPEAGE